MTQVGTGCAKAGEIHLPVAATLGHCRINEVFIYSSKRTTVRRRDEMSELWLRTSGIDSCEWCCYPLLRGSEARPREAEMAAIKEARRKAGEAQ